MQIKQVKAFIVIFMLLVFGEISSQNKKIAYLFFDRFSEETFTFKKEGRRITRAKYEINYIRKIGSLDKDFFIFDEHFKYIEGNDIVELFQEDLDSLKFNTIKDLKKEWEKREVLNKEKVYDKIYLLDYWGDPPIDYFGNPLYKMYEVIWIEANN
ncbi:hypothetical protein [Winogradskyella sp. 3972H.M.0a.05]|uniref:hypothetical protein n=1 Tax=Winogradskyella sp. 3972H.M.0a.05 TaxID=2950277 RepID=UPI00339500F0